MTGIVGDQLITQLIECCDDDLQFDLHRSVGPDLSNKTEAAVLGEIKRFAVEEENTLIARNTLRGMTQNEDEDIRHFAARIKGQANTCNYTVKCASCSTDISFSLVGAVVCVVALDASISCVSQVRDTCRLKHF